MMTCFVGLILVGRTFLMNHENVGYDNVKGVSYD